MHRSGTSLVSQWMHKCNLNLGDRLLGKGIGNVEGHYEDLDFLDLHEQILNSNNSDNRGIKNIEELYVNTYFSEKMKSIIDLKNTLHSQWGWKEPRTCLFIDYYKQIIPEATFLVVFRDANSVVDSLLRRDIKNQIKKIKGEGWRKRVYLKLNKKKICNQIIKENTEMYFKAWLTYNYKIKTSISITKDNQYKVVQYENLLKSDRSIITWLKGEGFDVEYQSFSSVYKKDLIKNAEETLTIHTDLLEEIEKLENYFLNEVSN